MASAHTHISTTKHKDISQQVNGVRYQYVYNLPGPPKRITIPDIPYPPKSQGLFRLHQVTLEIHTVRQNSVNKVNTQYTIAVQICTTIIFTFHNVYRYF